jgi:hypothetical protein
VKDERDDELLKAIKMQLRALKTHQNKLIQAKTN